jgi:DNA-directed RNA polymerase subunit B'
MRLTKTNMTIINVSIHYFLFLLTGIPSRMSIGHLMEMLGGRVAAAYGELMNGTGLCKNAYKACMGIAEDDFAFLYKTGAAIGECDLSTLSCDEDRIKVMSHALKLRGFKEFGEETLYNGITGKRIGGNGCNGRGAGKIFVGPLLMYKLIHLGPDKMHSRSTGLRHSFTRQSVSGSKYDGGYKTGKMEADCILTHGASYLLRERYTLVCDLFATHFCTRCGYVSESNMRDHLYYCKMCKSNANVGKSPISYSFALLYRHLVAAGIVPRIRGKNV